MKGIAESLRSKTWHLSVWSRGSVGLMEAIKNFALWMTAEKDIAYAFTQAANCGEIFRGSRKAMAGKPKAGPVWMGNPTDDVIGPRQNKALRFINTIDCFGSHKDNIYQNRAKYREPYGSGLAGME